MEAAGRTDLAIARDLLLAAGVERSEIDARAMEVAARAVAAYADLCPDDLSPRLAPGVRHLPHPVRAEEEQAHVRPYPQEGKRRHHHA